MTDAPLLSLTIDRRLPLNPARQLFEALRAEFLAGRLGAGSRLPSTRAMAGELGLARSTVVTAYEQLAAEGYVETRPGAGVYVADLPEQHLQITRQREPSPARPPPLPAPACPFRSGVPDMRLFPHQAWGRTMARVWRRGDPTLFSSGDVFGDSALRQAIATHLAEWRGVSTDAGRVIITSGAAGGISAAIAAVTQPGDHLVIEDPCYPPLRRMGAAAGLTTVSLSVDDEGIDVARLPADARLIIVTPSHQFPLGTTMSLRRRLALIERAAQQGAMVIEDDYDSEFRFAGQPIPALSALDGAAERVIYAGSFSKIFSSGLRLGYLVVPDRLVARLRALLPESAGHASIAAQRPLAEFIATGEFARHIRRMRRIYRGRSQALQAAFAGPLAGLFEPSRYDAGMTVAAQFTPALAARMHDVEAAKRAAAAGVDMRPLSLLYTGGAGPPGLLFGFAAFDENEIAQAALKLSQALA